MNWTLILLIFLTGCTVTVKPLATKTQHAPVHKPTRYVSKPISPNIKETWWLENYHKLESMHGDYTIPADANIRPLPDGKFVVPESVLNHYQDLLLAKPSPTPTY